MDSETDSDTDSDGVRRTSPNTSVQSRVDEEYYTRWQILAQLSQLSVATGAFYGLQAAHEFLTVLLFSHIDKQKNALAAGALILATRGFCLVTATAGLNVLPDIVSRFHSNGLYPLAGRELRRAYLWAMLFSLPAIYIYYDSERILTAFGQPQELIHYVNEYNHSALYALPAHVLLFAANRFTFGVQQKTIPVVISLLSLLVYLGIAYGCGFGKLGLPNHGVKALGYAETVRTWLAVLLYELAFLSFNRFERYALFRQSWRSVKENFFLLMRIGWPVMVNNIALASALYFINIMVGWVGKDALMANVAGSNWLVLNFMLTQALAEAVGIKVSYAVGHNKLRDVQRYGYAAMIMGMAISALYAVVVVICPEQFLRPFLDIADNKNQDVIALGCTLLRVRHVGQIFATVQRVSESSLNGMYYTLSPMFVNTFFVWAVGVVSSYELGVKHHDGVVPLALGLNIAIAISAMATFALWYQRSQRLPRRNRTETFRDLLPRCLFPCVADGDDAAAELLGGFVPSS